MMITLLRRTLILAFLAIASSYASTASAQGYLYSGMMGWPNGFYQDDHIPYYALHPPVYYSRPVPRPYGWSPWAYPPGVLTPPMANVVEPAIIDNPHVDDETVKPTRGVFRSKGTDQSASYRAPRVIHNPFVEPQVASGQ
jgi:hypothetical protein